MRHALQAQQAGTSRVHVVTAAGDAARGVLGYCALAAGSAAPAGVAQRLAQGGGRYDQPVVILTRLGVDLSCQRMGLGRGLVVDALRRVAVAPEVIGVRALLIHCENDLSYAQANDWQFNLYANSGTRLSGRLQTLVDSGQINLIRNIP